MQMIEGHSSTRFYDATEAEYDELTELWEASVSETHHFLTPSDVAAIKREVRNEYIPAAKVAYMRNDTGAISGFVGVVEDKIEMLFVSPRYMGMSIGKRLLMHAVFEMKAHRLDVNERNEGAVGFYLRQGCKVTGRSPLDAKGRPFPILHMECSYSG